MKSYIPYSTESDFPIQNLPYGVFSTKEDATPRIGVAIGEFILDLKNTNGIFQGPIMKNHLGVFQEDSLNSFMALDRSAWKEARQSLQSFLSAENSNNRNRGVFVKQAEAKMHLPARIGDYTDFMASYDHAANCDRLFPIKILSTNWPHMPVCYHGRASSIMPSETDVKRPVGQIKRGEEQCPALRQTERLDFELEVGVFVGGSLNSLAEPINAEDADQFIFGMVLLNDWSARDIQLWEMVPLGPMMSKNFCTTISPWIVTMEALEPFKIANMIQKPTPLPYLMHSDPYNFDINLTVVLQSKDDVSTELSLSNYKYLYWTAKQQLAHHTITGCNMRPGDLLGSGTISGPVASSYGSMCELTANGTVPLILANGEKRVYLEDWDRVIFTGHCNGNGYKIGFGSCAGRIIPARKL